MSCGRLWMTKAINSESGLAIDAATREVMGCHIGERSRASARSWWQSIPAVYRQCAVVVYTDYWAAYEMVILAKRHRAVGKDSGLTSDIEGFNNTLRQR